jgi:hypothetical protein
MGEVKLALATKTGEKARGNKFLIELAVLI